MAGRLAGFRPPRPSDCRGVGTTVRRPAGARPLQSGASAMRPPLVHRPALVKRTVRPLLGLLLLSTSLTACLSDAYDQGDEDLGDIGDGKSDSFGIVDRGTYVSAGATRHFTFSATAAFRLTIAQPSANDQILEVSLTTPAGDTIVKSPASRCATFSRPRSSAAAEGMSAPDRICR